LIALGPTQLPRESRVITSRIFEAPFGMRHDSNQNAAIRDDFTGPFPRDGRCLVVTAGTIIAEDTL
jgi:hypothetical protein